MKEEEPLIFIVVTTIDALFVINRLIRKKNVWRTREKTLRIIKSSKNTAQQQQQQQQRRRRKKKRRRENDTQKESGKYITNTIPVSY